MSNDTCKGCRFYDRREDEYGQGLCRRRVPVLMGDHDEPTTHWPHVTDEDWCGELERPGTQDTRIWQRAHYSVERENHVYYVGGKYAGSVYRDGDCWAWCLAGGGDDMTEVTGLAPGKAAVELAAVAS